MGFLLLIFIKNTRFITNLCKVYPNSAKLILQIFGQAGEVGEGTWMRITEWPVVVRLI